MATSRRTVSPTNRASRAAASAPAEVLTAPAINLQRIVKSVDPLGQAGAALAEHLDAAARDGGDQDLHRLRPGSTQPPQYRRDPAAVAAAGGVARARGATRRRPGRRSAGRAEPVRPGRHGRSGLGAYRRRRSLPTHAAAGPADSGGWRASDRPGRDGAGRGDRGGEPDRLQRGAGSDRAAAGGRSDAAEHHRLAGQHRRRSFGWRAARTAAARGGSSHRHPGRGQRLPAHLQRPELRSTGFPTGCSFVWWRRS